MRILIILIILLSSQICFGQDSVYYNLEQALTNPDAVIELNLQKQKLTEFPDSALRLFPNLKKLDLSRNKITSLPEDLSYLEGLELLDLSANRISQIPTSIGNLTKLNRLELSFNALRELPVELYQLINLRYLGLAGNNLDFLSEEIVKLQNLQELDVRGKQLNFLPKSELEAILKHKVKVRKSLGCGC